MAGPVIFPYNVYPVTEDGQPIWSDALQDWVKPGYARAHGIIAELGDVRRRARRHRRHRAGRPLGAGRAQPGRRRGRLPRGVSRRRTSGSASTARTSCWAAKGPRPSGARWHGSRPSGEISSIHLSAPDRGQLADSWIPWRTFLDPILPVYDGPFLVEVFNAVPAFLNSFRLTRRKFWIPGEDAPVPGVPDAYTVAAEAISTVRDELSQFTAASLR